MIAIWVSISPVRLLVSESDPTLHYSMVSSLSFQPWTAGYRPTCGITLFVYQQQINAVLSWGLLGMVSVPLTYSLNTHTHTPSTHKNTASVVNATQIDWAIMCWTICECLTYCCLKGLVPDNTCVSLHTFDRVLR